MSNFAKFQDIGSWADEVDADIAQEEYKGFKETNSSAANQAATSGVKVEEEEEQQQPLYTAKFINLDWQTTEEEFRELFKDPSLGITKIDFLYDKQNKPRGIAFIDFETEADLTKVVTEWNNYELNGRNIKVFAFDHNKPKHRTNTINVNNTEGGRDFSNWDKREPSFNRNNNTNNTFTRTRSNNNFNGSNNSNNNNNNNNNFRRDEWKSTTPATATPVTTNTTPASTEPSRPRVKLNLAPRTKPLNTDESTTRPSSLFGAAKPVDTAKKIREIEERTAKLEQERLEREQKLAEKAQAEREAKAKLEAARKSFAALSTEDEAAKDEEVEEEITSSRKKEDLTAAEKLLYAEATQEELDGDGWSVVGSGKRSGRR